MTVKGYYPSVSLGFEILIAVINILAGSALLIFGVVIMLGEVAQMEGLILVGVLAIPGGVLAIASGGLALTGSCKESVNAVKTAYILSIITLVVVGGIAGYTFSVGGGLQESARRNWFQFNDEQKKTIESHYACCGFTSAAEKSEGCEPEQTCGEPLVADLGGKLKVLAIIAAVVAGIQLGAILCGCCVWGRMRGQQEHKMRKAKITLAEEAQGGYKHKGRGASSGKSKDKASDKRKGSIK